ncbi:hypothetical protein ISCGN_020669 [Ixodes scapularis]
MNRLWMVTFKTEEAKLRLVTAKELEVKGKRCIVVDPENADVRMKLHWLSFHASDETVRRAIEPFGKVQDLTHEKWKAEGFTGVQSTTRLVRLSLKEGVTLECVPHQLRITGGNVLVVIPGRDLLCLRCKGTGLIRLECCVLRCDECHRFRHKRDNCVHTYATVTQEVVADGGGVLNMDEEEAEEAARDVETEVSATAGAKEVHPPQLQPEGDAMKFDHARASSSRPVISSDVHMSILNNIEAIQVLESKDTNQERDSSKRLKADVNRVELRKLLRDFDLVDAKDNEKTVDPTYTHWQGNCHARLDRIYLSGEFSAMTPVLEVLPLAFSDQALVKVLEKEYSGAKVRSRTLFLERDEEPSKIFKTKERLHASRNKIGKLQVADVEVTRQEEIEQAFLQAYTDLFTRAEDDGVLQTTGVALHKISPKVRKQMNRKITASEVEEAIKKLATRKSPGVDGLGSQFYKMFSAQLCPILRDVYANVLMRGLLPPSMRQAVTVLIQKKNSKGTPKVDHFRPISLLTRDYKILAKILAKRLEWGLRDVVGEHQAYGIKGRTISTYPHAMRIVCEAAQVLKRPVAVLQVDLSKAFDRVRHSFLFRLMKECGIGVRLLRYVQLCYRDIKTRLLVNGNRTAPIAVTRSLRQGCPISPILFALYLEPFCRAIIGDASIRKLSLASGTLKVLAYADGVTVLCSSRAQVHAVTQHIADFCSVSGAAMNTDKSVGAWLGDWDLKPEQFLGVTWTTSVSNYLGLSLTAEHLSGRCGGLDINRLRSKVLDWHARELSLFNRAFICNLVFFPTVWYAAQVLPCSQSDVAKAHRFFATFIWDSCFERMRRDNVFVSQKKGGLGLVNVELKLKVQRFLFFRDQGNPLVIPAFNELGGSFSRPWLEGDTGDFRARALKFYQEIAAAKEFFRARFSDEYLQKVKKKSLYWDTVDLLISPPPLSQLSGKCE